MRLTEHLPADRRAHVEERLRGDLMAWLTTVRPDGRPDTVPVWFLLRDDEAILVYSQPAKVKLRNVSGNPHVSLVLDGTNVGSDVIRVEGTAEHVPGFPPADQVPEYAEKYAGQIGRLFGTAAQFGALYPEALLITPARLRA